MPFSPFDSAFKAGILLSPSAVYKSVSKYIVHGEEFAKAEEGRRDLADTKQTRLPKRRGAFHSSRYERDTIDLSTPSSARMRR